MQCVELHCAGISLAPGSPFAPGNARHLFPAVVAAINTAMAALTKTVSVFPRERAIVQRERTKGSYDLAPYLASKLIAEAPVSAAFPLVFGALVYPMARLNPSISRFGAFSGILTVEAFAASAMGLTVGAIAPTLEAANALGPSLMTAFIVFGGYYVNQENTPAIFRWIPQCSLIRWAFQALCINEFKGLKFERRKSFDVEEGEQVLDRLSFGKTSVREAITQDARIAAFFYYLTYVFLKRNKPQFQFLEDSPLAVTLLPQEEVEQVSTVKIEELTDDYKSVSSDNHEVDSSDKGSQRSFMS